MSNKVLKSKKELSIEKSLKQWLDEEEEYDLRCGEYLPDMIGDEIDEINNGGLKL